MPQEDEESESSSSSSSEDTFSNGSSSSSSSESEYGDDAGSSSQSTSTSSSGVASESGDDSSESDESSSDEEGEQLTIQPRRPLLSAVAATTTATNPAFVTAVPVATVSPLVVPPAAPLQTAAPVAPPQPVASSTNVAPASDKQQPKWRRGWRGLFSGGRRKQKDNSTTTMTPTIANSNGMVVNINNNAYNNDGPSVAMPLLLGVDEEDAITTMATTGVIPPMGTPFGRRDDESSSGSESDEDSESSVDAGSQVSTSSGSDQDSSTSDSSSNSSNGSDSSESTASASGLLQLATSSSSSSSPLEAKIQGDRERLDSESSSSSSSSYYSGSSTQSSSLGETEAYSEADTEHTLSTHTFSTPSQLGGEQESSQSLGIASAHSHSAASTTSFIPELERVTEHSNREDESTTVYLDKDESETPSFALDRTYSSHNDNEEGGIKEMMAPFPEEKELSKNAATLQMDDREWMKDSARDRQEEETGDDGRVFDRANVQQQVVTSVGYHGMLEVEETPAEELGDGQLGLTAAKAQKASEDPSSTPVQAEVAVHAEVASSKQQDVCGETVADDVAKLFDQTEPIQSEDLFMRPGSNAEPNLDRDFSSSQLERLQEVTSSKDSEEDHSSTTERVHNLSGHDNGFADSLDNDGTSTDSLVEEEEEEEHSWIPGTEEFNQGEEEPVMWEEHVHAQDQIDPVKPEGNLSGDSSTEESETGWPSEDESSHADSDCETATMPTFDAISMDQHQFGPIEPVIVASVHMVQPEPTLQREEDILKDAVGALPDATETQTGIPSVEKPRDLEKPRGIALIRRMIFGRPRSLRYQAFEESEGPVMAVDPLVPLPGEHYDENEDVSSSDASSSEDSFSSGDSSSSEEASSSDEDNSKKLFVILEHSREHRRCSTSTIDTADAVAAVSVEYETGTPPSKTVETTERTATDVTASSTDETESVVEASMSGKDFLGKPIADSDAAECAVVVPQLMTEGGVIQASFRSIGPEISEEPVGNGFSVSLEPETVAAPQLLPKDQAVDGNEKPDIVIELADSRSDPCTETSAQSCSSSKGELSSEYTIDPVYGAVSGHIEDLGRLSISLASATTVDEVSSFSLLDTSVDESTEEFKDEHIVIDQPLLKTAIEDDFEESKSEEWYHDEEMGVIDDNFARDGTAPVFPNEAVEPLIPEKSHMVHQGEADLPAIEEGKSNVLPRSVPYVGYIDESGEEYSSSRRKIPAPTRWAYILLFFVIVPVVIIAIALTRDDSSTPTAPQTNVPTLAPTNSPTDSKADVIFRDPKHFPTNAPSSVPTIGPTTVPTSTALDVSFSPILSLTSIELWEVDLSLATVEDPTVLYAAHLGPNVTLSVTLPEFGNETTIGLYTMESASVEFGSPCLTLNSTVVLDPQDSAAELEDKTIPLEVFLGGTESVVFVCNNDTVVGASYHIFPDEAILGDAYFSVTVDFTENSLNINNTLEWGPGVGLNGATFLFLLGDDNTTFFEGGSASLALGDPCSEAYYRNECNTTFPAACFVFDEPVDETIYVCNGTVVGRLFLDFVPLPEQKNSTSSTDIFI